MTERKTLTITQVEEVKKVGDKQIPKLTFRAKDGENELTYFTFKSSLFDFIKTGNTISADIDVATRDYQGNTYTDRRVVQVYQDGQPISQKGYRGKSPEELELSARAYALSYAKDLAVAGTIKLGDITNLADDFYAWLKKIDKPVEEPEKPEVVTVTKVQNVTELKALLAKHKIGTREAYEILSINSFMELTDVDEAWADIKKAKNIA